MTATMTSSRAEDAPDRCTAVRGSDRGPLHDENVELVRGLSQLRAGLQAATRDNVDVRRELADVRQASESRRLAAAIGRYHREREDPARAALSEPWSRNH